MICAIFLRLEKLLVTFYDFHLIKKKRLTMASIEIIFYAKWNHDIAVVKVFHYEIPISNLKFMCMGMFNRYVTLKGGKRGNPFCYGALLEGNGGSSDTVT